MIISNSAPIISVSQPLPKPQPTHQVSNTKINEVELKSLSNEENFLEFGRLQLGPAVVESWERKGLEVSEEALKAAAQAGIDAVKNLYDKNAQGGVAINAHKIVMENQNVPEWFMTEYQSQLDTLPRQIREDFESGALYSITVREPNAAKALNEYDKIGRY